MKYSTRFARLFIAATATLTLATFAQSGAAAGSVECADGVQAEPAAAHNAATRREQTADARRFAADTAGPERVGRHVPSHLRRERRLAARRPQRRPQARRSTFDAGRDATGRAGHETATDGIHRWPERLHLRLGARRRLEVRRPRRRAQPLIRVRRWLPRASFDHAAPFAAAAGARRAWPRSGHRRGSWPMLAAVVASRSACRHDARAADAARDDEAFVTTWRTLRAVDCARCHGNDYDGLAAPSIVDYARLVSRDRFVAAILDGNPSRGMPAYRDNAAHCRSHRRHLSVLRRACRRHCSRRAATAKSMTFERKRTALSASRLQRRREQLGRPAE